VFTSKGLCWRRLAGGLGRSRLGSRRGGLVHIRQDGAIVVVVLSQQRSHFTQLFGRLLQHLDLLAQLRVLGLLPPQNLVDVLHTTP